MKPTAEQQNIISADGNCVVIARPGSGKTFTIAQKVIRVLPQLLHYQGIVAISFTNKSSRELERRCMSSGMNRRGSFFGTIDKFLLSEIILPFGQHIFGQFHSDVKIKKAETFHEVRELIAISRLTDIESLTPKHHDVLSKLFMEGEIALETASVIANYIFSKSTACRKYIRAKYTHLFIDEYQDCDAWQNQLFLKFAALDISCIAVGDMDQSIFAFAGKSNEHLQSLTADSSFSTFVLSENHRCHHSIVNYSMQLISKNYSCIPTSELRVLHKHITGDENQIAEWIDMHVAKFITRLKIEKRNRIGILVRNKLTENLIHKTLKTPHKTFGRTILDDDPNDWSRLFCHILTWMYSEKATKYELAENYVNPEYYRDRFREVMNRLSQIESIGLTNKNTPQQTIALFIQVAESIFPNGRNDDSIEKLSEVIGNTSDLSNFIPAKDGELQLLSLHKSKGLEFDLVFHLNLYEYVLPQYKGNYSQDLNLHYVGITRAKNCCVLISSTQRTRKNYDTGDLEVIDASPSEFLHLNSVDSLRIGF